MSRTPFLDSLTTLVKNGTNIGHLYIFSSGHYADIWGNKNLSSTGSTYILRDGLYADAIIGNNKLSTTNTGLSGSELSFGVKAKRGAKNPSGTIIKIIENGSTFYHVITNTTLSTCKMYFITNTGLNQTGVIAGYNFLQSQIKVISGSVRNENSDGARCYIDGLAIPHPNIDMIGKTLVYPPGVLSIPFNATTSGFEGKIYYYWEINKYLTAAEHLQLKNELDSIKFELKTHARVINPADRSVLYDFKTYFGTLCTTAAVGGSTIARITNTMFRCGNTVGRFTLTYETGPGGIYGKVITAKTGGPLNVRVPNGVGTWTYWHKTSAGSWTNSPAAIRSGTLDTTFTLATGDKLWYAGDGNDSYDMTHTPT